MHFIKIEKVVFYENDSISSNELNSILYSGQGDIYSHFSHSENIKAIIEHYRQKGFFNTKIKNHSDSTTSSGIILTYTIEECPRSYINSITVFGPDINIDMSMFREYRILPGKPMDQYNLSMVLYSLASKYINKGYYNTEIYDSLIQDTSDFLLYDIVIDIDEGEKIFIQAIEIQGNENVRSKLIYREIEFKAGDIFYPALMDITKSRLYYMNLFSYVSIRPLFSKVYKDSVKIIIKVEESKPSYIMTGIGYQSDNKVSLNLSWGNNNLFGNAQKIKITGSYLFDFKGNYSLVGKTSYYEPYFLNSGFIVGLEISGEKLGGSERSASSAEILGIFGRKISKFGTVYLGYKYHLAWIDTSFSEQRFAESYTNSMILTYEYDSRDTPFAPTRGFYQKFGFEYAGGYLKGDNDFYRYSWNWARIRNPEGLGGYLYLNAYYTNPYGKNKYNEISPDQKLHLGGVNSLRGYREKSIGDLDEIGIHSGNILCNFMSEVHYRFNFISLGIFLDGGGLWNNDEEISLNTNTGLGIGLGFSFQTPAGPIRLEYGHSLSDPYSNNGILHFALGYPF